jgi:flagellar motility protein MotE (MotC chaperone)
VAGLSEGQVVALLTVAGTIVVGAVGQVAAKYGTFTSRQTELEKNLLEQVKMNATRIDTIERERTALEASFRVQLEAAATERRVIEREFREQLRKLEQEMAVMEQTNLDLKHENWLLKQKPSVIGIAEVIDMAAGKDEGAP